ncbi:molybdopterin-guanine dinucleotide biosynthesis protein B [Thermincola ferriacetica]|uniref:Molybdopterin-guanine dinucleotide biosynthesis protein B n=1 Tax=Thermincola ferriacetica TaxID=281456 RepID=A0A0L6W0K0_9FIRM|nr:molybdopterin-guanine dinucleotide biosynthesis protein B [Thermincola ferriacetica]KNZ68609.1 molybdopterin-guanine dinucleotide biosynthesis protein B [Thermincola ferriacetica]
MIPFVGIVGFSNTGKTTLMEKLIRELTVRGYRVAAIKHHHRDMEFDRPGKDTWRHARAGAATVMLVSPYQMVKISKSEQKIGLQKALQEITDADIILVEGFKKEKMPKIEVFRGSVHDALITSREELVAVVASDREFTGVPCYGPDDVKELADLIVKEFLKEG